MLFFAPFLSLLAIAFGGIATAVAAILNGPRRLRRRPEPPIVVLPPVPSPQLQMLVEQAEREPALAL